MLRAMSRPQHNLKPLDVFVACRLALPGGGEMTQKQVAYALSLAKSTTFVALQSLRRARLVACPGTTAAAARTRLCAFLVHGVPVVFAPVKTAVVRGLPTGIFSPHFRERFAGAKDIPLVWPYPRGRETGEGLVPLYPSLPLACSRDPALYQMMAAIDVLRVGRVREREAAVAYIEDVLGKDVDAEDDAVEERLEEARG